MIDVPVTGTHLASTFKTWLFLYKVTLLQNNKKIHELYILLP